ncbi:Hypothetical predicted protein [Paramuricea clavata]|uniref:Calcyclin-binding protein n=1 Tax=Paramuricea clavata TaxID=317549 RepID=A0A6S7G306_PARCT|nr:Hypothetical predicted protein [Paramuricea clavata]
MAELTELRSDRTELKDLLEQAKRPRVRVVLQNELSSVDAKIHEIERQRLQDEVASMDHEDKENPSISDSFESRQKTTREGRVQRSKITSYGFLQKPQTVTIYVDLASVGSLHRDLIQVDYGRRSLNIVINNLNGKTYELNLPNLGGEIVPEKCKYKVKPNTITVILKKARDGDWAGISATEVKEKKAREEKTRMGDLDKDKDPSESLMDLMKKMYDEGDDEMKRTIAKAWTESREKQAAGSMI